MPSETIDIPQINTSSLGILEASTEVDLPEFDSLLDTDTTGDGIWYDYLIEIEFFRDRHILQMPHACSTDTECSFATVAQRTMKKRVTWEATKIGTPPICPLADTNNDNEICLDDTVSTVVVDVGSSGQIPIYTMIGEYLYGVIDESIVEYFFPVPPYLTLEPCSLPTIDFQSGIIDCGGGEDLQDTDTYDTDEDASEGTDAGDDEYVPEDER